MEQSARHKNKARNWLKHKTRRADIRTLVNNKEGGTALGPDYIRFDHVYAQMLTGQAIGALDISRAVHERYGKLPLACASHLSKDCEFTIK